MKVALATLALVAFAACQGPTAPQADPRPAGSSAGFFNNGDVRLSYRLDLPSGDRPAPAVVFGHGSGRATKSACRFLADSFLQRGYATLCFDKRGVGESSGEYANVGIENSNVMFATLASDLAAAVRFLRTTGSIDGTRIGLAGNSQAGWIIPIAAAQAQPAFMILLVGPTVSVGEEIFYSHLVEFNSAPLDDAYQQTARYQGPRGFDPVPTLESLRVPGLWLLGGSDRSIPTPATAGILDRLAQTGRPFTHVIFEGAGHDLSGAPIWQHIDSWLQTLR